MRHERRIRWHWQNLSKDEGHCRFPINGRAWLYVFAWTLQIEWHFWHRACRVGVDIGGYSNDLTAYVCVAPVSLYFSIEAPWKSWLGRLCNKNRECYIAVHDWAIWIHPWSKWGEWCRSDPWYVRGVTFHIDDFFLGRQDCLCEETKEPQRITVSLDGHEYHGTATFKRRVWWRPRWFAKSRKSTWIEMDPGHGLPAAGKGENSWDCGDDATTGWGHEGFDVEAAIAHGVDHILKRRKRYGEPSKYGPQQIDRQQTPADDLATAARPSETKGG